MQNLPVNENRNHQGLEASLTAGALSPFELIFKVDQIIDGHAVLTSQETGAINWPTARTPSKLEVGDQIILALNHSNGATPENNSKCCENCNDLNHLRTLLEELVS
ncbi:hypothetical protein HN748_05010 [Candidatus Peregrinibacteria bacterium]|jgi:hypothetical protein|nr:hypothetical protein [Candidatus Peregrinibacteria bacterium]MBT7483724.1 hypothetical protein [Candidatus Peregrinibacteria bacterium]MBT7703569.1 hypothetical protein [Candidatus Peregrinibacteria bacterium]